MFLAMPFDILKWDFYNEKQQKRIGRFLRLIILCLKFNLQYSTKKKECLIIFKNINLKYFTKKFIYFGSAFLLTAILSAATVVIRGTSASINIEEQKIKIYDSYINKDVEVNLEELLIGALAAEMPITWHIEALKAQVVTIFSYFLYKNGLNSNLDLNYTKNSSIKHFVYNSPEKRRERWGDKFEEYEQKAKNAVNAVKNKVIYYDGKPALAMFFSCCYKKTTPCSVGFSQDLPYLTEVDSKEYKFINLEKNFEIKKIEMTKILKEKFINDEFSSRFGDLKKYSIEEFSQELEDTDPKDWFKVLATSDNGNVLKLKILDSEITGQNFRHIVGTTEVRSSNFTINYDSEKETFTVTSLGYGHGVGMSQWGAKFMADSGANFEQILQHYYPGTEIKDFDNFGIAKIA